MPDRIEFFKYLPEWIKGIGAIISAAGTFMVAYLSIVSWRKKKRANESKHAQSFRKAEVRDSKVDEVINMISAAIEHAGVVSISQWKNGDLPKEFRIIRSTDFNTWTIWKNYNIAEPDLAKIQSAALDDGQVIFKPSQLHDPITRDWYEGNGILQTLCMLVAVNDFKNESVVLYINFSKEHLVSAKTRKLLRIYLTQLQEAYEPHGWLSKKNYLIP